MAAADQVLAHREALASQCGDQLAHAFERVVVEDDRLQRLRDLGVQSGAAHQHQPVEELGPLHREAERGRAAHRIADERSAAELQRGAEIAEVTIARRLRVFERLGLGRATEADHVERDDPMRARQVRNRVMPVAGGVRAGAAAVQEHDRRGSGIAGLEVMSTQSTRVDEAAGPGSFVCDCDIRVDLSADARDPGCRGCGGSPDVATR